MHPSDSRNFPTSSISLRVLISCPLFHHRACPVSISNTNAPSKMPPGRINHPNFTSPLTQSNSRASPSTKWPHRSAPSRSPKRVLQWSRREHAYRGMDKHREGREDHQVGGHGLPRYPSGNVDEANILHYLSTNHALSTREPLTNGWIAEQGWCMDILCYYPTIIASCSRFNAGPRNGRTRTCNYVCTRSSMCVYDMDMCMQ